MRRLTELVVAEVLDVSHVQAADAIHLAEVPYRFGDIVILVRAKGAGAEAYRVAGRVMQGDDFVKIFDAVRDAGVDGVGIVDLSKLVRSTFRSFKVRDHGFAQMRQYIASLADIKVEKRGSDYFAVLEE